MLPPEFPLHLHMLLHLQQSNPLQRAQQQWTTLFDSATTTRNNRPVILSVANQRANAPWGDFIAVKSETTTRVYGLNVNGFTLDRRGGQFSTLCEVMKEVQADVFLGSEYKNLDSADTQVRSILFDTAHHQWQRSRSTIGTTPIALKNVHKPGGGCCILSVNDITGCLIHQERDPWRRWVSQTFQGKGGLKITMHSAHQVVTKKSPPGKITAASQEEKACLCSKTIPLPTHARCFAGIY